MEAWQQARAQRFAIKALKGMYVNPEHAGHGRHRPST